ncbi:MAG: TRAP transporter permease [Chloroflexota bacterium]
MSSGRKLQGFSARVATVVAVSMSVYAILYLGDFLRLVGINILTLPHRALILTFLITLSLLVLPGRKDEARGRVPWYDVLLIILGTAGPLYLFFFWERLADRFVYQEFYPSEIALAVLTTVVVLEITRRIVGWAMPLISLVFLLHMFFGSYFPGFLNTESVSLNRAAGLLFFTESGIWGIALGVAATIIIMFMIFSQFLLESGAGQSFIDFAMALFGPFRGGPAKVAVIASALFGTISGSPPSNVAATGTFTIPLMKSIGYKPEFAGAVEAVASTGGQLMPPVMGTIAFLIANWLGISYWAVCVAAFLPSVLYYVAVYLMVDAEAVRLGLKGIPRAQCPSLKKTLLEGWPFLLPVVSLLYFLGALKYSATTSALYALGILLVISMLRRKTRFGPKKVVSSLRGASMSMLPAGNACACAGIMIGALNVTQLGLKFSSAAVALAGDSMLVLLLLTGVGSFVMGMGMAGIPAYIMTVVFVGPALVKMGVLPLAAHLFVFYWVTSHFFTPPVGTAFYVAAGIAGAPPMKTGVISMKLGILAYIVPFIFVYQPALMLMGTPTQIALVLAASLAGVTLIAWGATGYGLGRVSWLERLLFLGAGLLLLMPGWTNNLTGLVLGSLVLAWQQRRRLLPRPDKAPLPQPAGMEKK